MLGCDVWIANTKTGQSKDLTGGRGTSWSPVWSPDSNYLAFYSDVSGTANLWLWEKSSGNLRQVSKAIVRSFNGFEQARWTPDSKYVVTKILPERMTIEDVAVLTEGTTSRSNDFADRPTVTVFRSPTPQNKEGNYESRRDNSKPSDSTNLYLADVALVNIMDGKTRRLAIGHKPVGVWISPDGKNVAFTDVNGGWNVFDLVVVSLTTNVAGVVASSFQNPTGMSVSWSPDGMSLSYIASTAQGKKECYVVAIGGGNPRNLNDTSPLSFGDLYHGPNWDGKGKFLYFLTSNALWKVDAATGNATEVARIPNKELVEIVSPAFSGRFWSTDGGRSMRLITRDLQTRQMGFVEVDLATGMFASLIEENKFYGFSPAFNVDVSNDGKTVVYAAEDGQHSTEIYVANSNLRTPRRLTKINPNLDSFIMGATRLIEWKSNDGQLLRGALLLPAGYQEGTKYPLIVVAYGGYYLSSYVNEFGLTEGCGDNMQLFATRGYAVLLPDAPLSIGTPMHDIAKTILPGVDRVIELGIADPDRIGVRGQSYGGYSALALIVQTTRFKAAVMSAGQGNLISKYGTMAGNSSSNIAWSETGQGRMGGTLWEYRERYVENSPVFYLDRVQTPLLIIHGTKDIGVPSFLADEVFVALRRLGKEVVYAKYDGESHQILGHANQTDYLNRMIAWFDDHLKKPEGEKPK